MFAKLFDKATASANPQHIVSDGYEECNVLDPRVVLHYGIPSTASRLAYDPIQHLLAIGTLDGRIKVIGGDNIEGLLISPKKLPFKNLEFIQSQGFLVSVSNEDDIQVWDLEHRCIVSSLQWESNVTAFSVIQGTNFMYLGDEYGTVSVLKYDCVGTKLLQLSYSIHADSASEASGIPLLDQHSVVGILPQPYSHGNRVLLAYDNGTIILWDISLDKMVLTRGCKDLQSKSKTIYVSENDPICKARDEEPDSDQVDKEISSLCWASMDGSTLAVGYIDGDIILWNLSNSAQNNDRKPENSANNVFKLQLSSADRKFPVIVLQWSAKLSNDNVQEERLYVYGGDKIGSAEVLTILNLDWSHGREALKNVSRVDLTLSGSFADVMLLQNFNASERTLSTSIFILTSPGQLQFYEDLCLSNLFSQQEKSSSSPLPYSSCIPTSEPCLTAGRLFMLHTDAEHSKALTEMVEAARWKRMNSANDEVSKWPLSGGVPCHFPESGDMHTERLYIAGYQDGSVQIWDATYPVLSWLFVMDPEVNGINIAGLTAPVSALDLSLTTLFLAIGNDNGLVRIYKLTGSCNETGMLLVTGTGSEVHDPGQGNEPQCTAVFSLCTSPVCTLRYTNQGDRLAVGFETTQVAMLDVSKSSVLFLTDALSGPSYPITAFSDEILLDAHSLITGSELCESISGSEPIRDLVLFLRKDLHITVLDTTLGKVIRSCDIKASKESSAISIYLLGGIQLGNKIPGEMHLDVMSDDKEGKCESAAIPESSSLEHGQETTGGETHVQHKSLDTLILVCCTNYLRLYTFKSLIQGNGSSIHEVNLTKLCCWTEIIREDNKNHGLLLFYQPGDMEIRSLPKLEVLGESSLTSILRWNMKANMHKTLSATDHGQIALVNGGEFAVLSVLAGENDFRIPESLPCLHDKVVAAVAESDLIVSPSQKKNKETPSGIFGGLIKGLRTSRDNQIVDPTEIYKVDQSSLGRIFTRSAKDQSSLGETSSAKYAGKVMELSIDDIEIDEPLHVSPLPGIQNNDKNEKKTEREKLFEGGTSETNARPRTIEEIKAKYRPATGDTAAAAAHAKDKLMERQEKLERLSKNTEELQSGACEEDMDLLPSESQQLTTRHGFRSLKLLNVDMDRPLGDKPFGVDYGRLDNGLYYYVRSNSKPKMRAALALAVKVGSVLEEEDERGVAHIVEHLAFSATTKFSNHDIVNFLESIGAEFGACQNAATSADETVYELFVPVDKPGVLSQAISVLAEFSTEIRVSADDLEKERGAVMEEYRGSRNANGRMQDAHWALMMAGSKYAERLPIGTESVIRSVSAETVKLFYRKWYHLNNMAVIAVGDFPDTESVVELIKMHFGVKTAVPDPPSMTLFEVPSHEEPRFSCFVESEAAGSAVMISCKMPVYELENVKDYRDLLVESLFMQALNQRLFKISHREDPPYFSCSAAADVLVCSTKAYIMTSSCKENGTVEALESMLIELARIRLHGFSEREISIVQALLMSEIESAYLERDQMQSTTLRDEYLQHFLHNEPVVGIEFEAQLQKTLLPFISASEVSRYAERFRISCSCVIKTIEPQATVTLDDLKGVVSMVNTLEEGRGIAAWEEDHIPEEIVSAEISLGSIVQQSEYTTIGVTELVLSNGMRVCYKCTDFLDDQVLFTGFSYGGLSELSESDYLSCSMGSTIAGEIGIFGYKPSVLMDMLAGKRAEVGTKLGAYMRSFSGDCSPTDLETALQLVYQLFATNVRPRDEEVRIVMQMAEEAVHAQERDPYTAFANRVRELNYGNSYFFKPIRISDLQKVDPFKACDYFNDCFKDPSTFTVVIVGNVDPEIARPLILQYLGGIPKPDSPILQFSRDDLKGLPFKFPEKIIREVVRSPMVEAQCSVQLSFPIELKNGVMIEEIHYVGFLSKLLETKMIQVLRFKHGQIYSAGVSVFLGGNRPSRTGDVRGDISINFSCDPKFSSTLVELALDEVLRLQEEGPSAQDVFTILEIEQRAHENGLQENYYWLDRVLRSYQSRIYSGDLRSSFELQEEARLKVRESLTETAAQAALRRVLPFPCRQQYTVVILMPQTSCFQLLRSLFGSSKRNCWRDAKVLVGIAGLTILGVSLWRYSRSTVKLEGK